VRPSIKCHGECLVIRVAAHFTRFHGTPPVGSWSVQWNVHGEEPADRRLRRAKLSQFGRQSSRERHADGLRERSAAQGRSVRWPGGPTHIASFYWSSMLRRRRFCAGACARISLVGRWKRRNVI
jgi:hypothetical protein